MTAGTSSKKPIIEVRNISKQYNIGMDNTYKTFAESFINTLKSPIRSLKSIGYQHDSFWALKDINFEVERGEVVGIIGRNGAGKSTLLKILSRITTPTEGKIRLRGRVGSLLEVGTGFHPELTGRENIYFNGAILGMKKKEIDDKFDEIVKFSGVKKFLDTPVKRYSSGMQVRLAFSVAAHLEPEILLVDEVLAVGDASFQKKCLGKMGEVAESGRTVLFVSHNMGAVSSLCNRVILLEGGKLEKDGLSADIISEYLQSGCEMEQHFSQAADNSIPLCLLEARVFSENKKSAYSFARHKPITVWMKYRVNEEISSSHVYSNILTSDGTIVLGTSDADIDQSRYGLRKPGVYLCQYEIPPNVLNEGDYRVSISLGIPYQKVYQSNNEVISFSVVNFEPIERFIHRRRAGVIRLNINWEYLGSNPIKKI